MKLKITALTVLVALAVAFAAGGTALWANSEYNMSDDWQDDSLSGTYVDVVVHTPAQSVGESFVVQGGDDYAAYLASPAGQNAKQKVIDANAKAKGDMIDRGLRFDEGYEFFSLESGFGAKVRYDDLQQIEALPSVAFVELCAEYAMPEAEQSLDELVAAAEAGNYNYNQNNIYDGTDLSQAKGGEGMLIGIIDTGIDVNHSAFSEMPQNGKYTKTNKYAMDNLLAIGNTYLTDKVVFGYDYVDEDTDVRNGISGDHGYHVSGIAAGNDGANFKGVAYNAQIAFFKIYGNTVKTGDKYDYSVSANALSVYAALQDAVALGCDVVSISLGITNNMAVNNFDESIYSLIEQMGVTLVASAGNGGSVFYARDKQDSNYKGYTEAFTKYQNVNLVGYPSDSYAALGVANAQLKDGGATISPSSSWGCLEDLTLKPDIAAVGTNVYSAAISTSGTYYGDPNYYEKKSGTSMSTPNAAGVATLVRAYYEKYRESFATPKDFKAFTDSILMSTATPISGKDNEGNDYIRSPRQQGAGLVNAHNAIASEAYAYVAGRGKAVLEFGDDPARSASYSGEIVIKNLSDTEKKYDLGGTVMTNRKTGEVNGQYVYAEKDTSINKNRVATPYTLKAKPAYISGSNSVTSITVPARQEVTLSVTITLDEQDKQYIDDYFPYGSFVEGYLTLDGDIDLSVPFLGFYGDWYESGIFDSTAYDSEQSIYTEALAYGIFGTERRPLGIYPYEIDRESLDDETEQFLFGPASADRIALGYGTDDAPVYFDGVDMYLLKNIKQLNVSVIDPATGRVYSTNTESNISKAHAANGNLSDALYKLSANLRPANATGANGLFANNSTVNVVFSANGMYDYTRGVWKDELIVPVYIDCEKPHLLSYSVDADKLKIELWDNHYIAAYELRTQQGVKGTLTPVVSEKSQIVNLEDLTAEGDKVYLYVVDYAGNSEEFEIDLKNSKTREDERSEYVQKTASEQGVPDFTVSDGNLASYTGGGSEWTVPAEVTRIGDSAFKTDKLYKITLPSGLLRIGANAFAGAVNLNYVTSLAMRAPLLETDESLKYDNFGNGEAKLKLLIPKNATGYGYEWQRIFDIHTADYQIEMDLDGGFGYDRFIGENGDTPALAEPYRRGYTFKGWLDENGEQYTPSAQDAKIKANWQINKYTVTINYHDSTQTEQLEFGTQFTLPEAQPYLGYSFSHYSFDGKTARAGEKVTIEGDMTITAVYASRTYNLEIVWDGGSASLKYDYGSGVENIKPTRHGYTLKNLYLDSARETLLTNENFPAENDEVTLYAVWEKASFTVSFTSSTSGITLPAGITAEYESTIILPNAPEKEGYEFIGYSYGGNTYRSGDGFLVTDNAVITLVYERGTYKINYHTGIDGYEIPQGSLRYNEKITLITPSFGSNEFLGWFADAALSSSFNTSRMPGNDIDVYAKWNRKYTVAFKPYGADAFEEKSETVNGGDSVSFAAEEIKGYTFLGWYDAEEGGNLISENLNLNVTPDKDAVYYARYSPKKGCGCAKKNSADGLTTAIAAMGYIALKFKH